MQTVIFSNFFKEKTAGKYSSDYIDQTVEKISVYPKAGKTIGCSKNIYQFPLGICDKKNYHYNLVYFYENRNTPIYFITIFKDKEHDVLNKAVFYLACDAMK